jgi:tetratricopeptide (TPR) repeat protein
MRTRLPLALLAIFALIAPALAQNAPQTAKPATAPPQNQPAAPQTSPSASGQTASQRHSQPQAKTKEEYAAYQTAVAVADPNAALAAADDFASKYPQSELRYVLYSTLLQKFYAADNKDKVIESGKKLLAIEPQDAMALIMVSTALAETTHETDLDRDEKYDEAMKDADAAVKNIDTGLVTTPQMSPDQVAAAKRELLSMGHAAMGYVELSRKNYALSEQHFKDAIAANPDQPDSTNYLRLAVAQDNLSRYADAMVSIDKALQLAQSENNAAVANIAKNEKDRLTKLAATAKPKQAPPKQ